MPNAARAEGGTWATKAPMPTARSSPAAIEWNGKIYAIGGHDGTRPIDTVEAYDPALNTWSASLKPMPTPRYSSAAAALGGKIYVAGGFKPPAITVATLEVYDPATDTWTTGPDMPTARGACNAAVAGGKLYVIGGVVNDGAGKPLPTVEMFDPGTGLWTGRAEMPTPRWDMGVVNVNEAIYAITGANGTSYPNAVEAYDPVANTWTSKAPIPTPRQAPAVAVVNGKIYVAGGLVNVAPGSLKALEVFDPVANLWATLTDMPTSRAFVAGAAASGAFYAIGGVDYTASPPLTISTVEAFTPAAPPPPGDTPEVRIAELQSLIASLPAGSFRGKNRANALRLKLEAVRAQVEAIRAEADPPARADLVEDAIEKLENDLGQKTDGCATQGAPDMTDWIVTCSAQAHVSAGIDAIVAAILTAFP
jgi:N-acetylneuraminic acid mutarotase